jgi:hypothetical protein
VTLPAAADEVWAHLREPVLIRRWFGWEYDGLSDEIDAIFLGEAAAETGSRSLRFDYGHEQRDRFDLEPDGAGTVLRVTRWGTDGGFDDIAEGWTTFVQQLRFAVARHPGEERRTAYVASGKGPDVPGIAHALGLADVAGTPTGGRYEATAGTGEPITGEVWFRTEHQLGLTVDQLGDGLLVMTEKPAAAKPPHGAAAMIVSAYGAAGGAALECSAQLEAWWREHVPATSSASSPARRASG